MGGSWPIWNLKCSCLIKMSVAGTKQAIKGWAPNINKSKCPKTECTSRVVDMENEVFRNKQIVINRKIKFLGL